MSTQPQSASRATSIARRIADELGVITLFSSPLDVKLLICQRFVRVFAFGCSTLILVTYLTDLGFSEDRVGLFMTLTLVGDIVISLVLTVFADRIGRRATLVLGSLLMTASGVVFNRSGNFWVLLAAAAVGVITPSGNEIGPFRAIEESIIACLTPASKRSDTFAWYIMLGPVGLAAGTIACGWIVNALVQSEWTALEAYRGIFFLYATLGVGKAVLSLLLSRKCEVEEDDSAQDAQTEPLLQRQGVPDSQPTAGASHSRRSLLPSIKKESVPVVIKLCVLFGLDSIAGALIPLSWQAFYFKTKFDLEDGLLGTIFFASNIIAAASVLVASSIAKRLGNVKTVVLASLSFAICQLALPVPSTLLPVLAILFFRSCVQTMETAPRAALLANVLEPTERTAIIGVLNVIRTALSALVPLATGILASNDLLWATFVLSGSIKIAYSAIFLVAFAKTEAQAENHPQTESTGGTRT